MNTSSQPILYFYLEPERFPYKYLSNLSFENKDMVAELAPRTSWWSWTLRTYLHLKDVFQCKLVDEMPDEGIIFFFRGSVNFFSKPKPRQFWVCMVGDSSWHLFSHINIFQNPLEATKWPNSFFINHWPLFGIIPSLRQGKPLKKIAYTGRIENLAVELRGKDWDSFCRENEIDFQIIPIEKWNDYSDIDLSIAIRSFNNNSFSNKPGSKLINSWIAGVPFIGGKQESAYTSEVKDIYDAILVDTYQELKEKITLLKNAPDILERYRSAAQKRGKDFSINFFVSKWEDLIRNHLTKEYLNSKLDFTHQTLFILRRYFYFRWVNLKSKIYHFFS